MKTRRHHNNRGDRQVRSGKTRDQVERIAARFWKRQEKQMTDQLSRSKEFVAFEEEMKRELRIMRGDHYPVNLPDPQSCIEHFLAIIDSLRAELKAATRDRISIAEPNMPIGNRLGWLSHLAGRLMDQENHIGSEIVMEARGALVMLENAPEYWGLRI